MHFSVSGMSCAACSSRVEKAVRAVPGVASVSVSLLTNTMTVEGSASSEEIILAVQKAGYQASSSDYKKPDTKKTIKDDETPHMKKRLICSFILLLLLMYISMGHVMLGLPLFSLLENNPIAVSLCQMLLTIAIIICNQKFFVSGFAGLMHKAPNMDTLVALGSGAAFIYSTAILFSMTAHPDHAAHLMHDLYFEASAMILTLITVGKMLEARAKGKTTDAIAGLMKLTPETATVIRNEKEITVLVKDIHMGDIFIVRPGENIPVDGEVIDGTSAVNESSLTGESIPSDKVCGDYVSAATTNVSGFLKCRATRVGEDTTIAQIIKTVSDAAASKAPIAKIADQVSGIFVPVVLSIALIVTVFWLFMGQTVGFSLARGISVLVISCPCALGLATPVAIMVGSGVGARHGILFKTAAALETAGKVQTVVLDKTGTITKGTPTTTDIIPFENTTKEILLKNAYALESKSEHPLAKAIVQEGEKSFGTPSEIKDFSIVPGHGLMGRIGTSKIIGGNMSFIKKYVSLPFEAEKAALALAAEGKTPLFFAEDRRFSGIIAVADTVKEDSKKAISDMKAMGLSVVMLTGDNQTTAQAIASSVGIREVVADVMPQDKAEHIKKQASLGTCMMVGDGINDAPALTAADIGVAIGAGTDIAMDAADVVLMNNSLHDVVSLICIGRATLRIIKQNLFWAFIYNIIGIPLAAGAFISLLHWEMNPMFGAFAMSLSSFCVVSNALRLNHTAIKKNEKKERKKTMEKVLKVEGMMCPHCEARVVKVLSELPGVSAVVASHQTGLVTVTMTEEVPEETIVQTIEAQGYKVI